MNDNDALERARALFAATPFVHHLGIQVTAVGHGRCETRMTLEPHHLQQHGFAHAGVLATIADHTAGGAAVLAAPTGSGVLSIEFKVNLLRPARGSALRCVAVAIKAGRTISVVESDVYCERDGSESHVCRATVTLAMLAPGQAP